MSETKDTPIRAGAEKRRRQIITIVAVLIVGGVLSYLAMGGIGENLVYYWSPSELLESGDKAVGASIRLGGLVEAGTIERSGDGLSLRFAVTDGKRSIPVTTQAVPPAMFREGIGVVVEGTIDDNGKFQTERLLVKHDNQYKSPEDIDNVNMQEVMKSMQFEESGT